MTSSTALKSLALKSFRGASTAFKISFEKGRKLTLVYGENGCGKTTICDAFEFLAAEKLGSLEGRGMGKGLENYWHTAGKSSADLEVILETGSGTCTGRIAKRMAVISPTDAKPYIELLRRQQILDLIEAQPAKRYDAIKRFIDVDAFQQSEETLRQTVKSLSDEKERAKERESENLATLYGFFEVAGKPAKHNPVSWAKEQLQTTAEELESEISAISLLQKKFAELSLFVERFDNRQNDVKNSQLEFNAAEDALNKAVETANEGAIEMLQLLDSGYSYLHSHPDQTECPLCSSAEKIGGLATRVKDRIEKLGSLKAANDEKKKHQVLLKKADDLFEQLKNEYVAACQNFAKTISDYEWRTEISLPQDEPPVKLASLGPWIASVSASAETWSEQEAAWRDGEKFTAALRTAVDQYNASLSTRLGLEALIPNMDEALRLCVDERQAFTDSIMTAIANEVGRLYELVHPGEGLDKIALPLDPKKRASVELQAKFAGQDVPPQAYFSQSHLDTLGLCVFIALALRTLPDQKTLILDDVLGSVDEPHVERVIQMIYNESQKFRHTIVTTHYRPWREKYRWGWLKPEQPCQFIELATWTIDDGLRDTSSLPEIERLKNLLQANPIDPQAICSKAGVILEAALDYLTQRYECSVPRRFGAAYTLGDLISAISGKLRETLVAEVREPDANGNLTIVPVSLKPILDELQRVAQVRNALGAHFKAISFDLLDADAVGFAKHVVALMDALTHPEHGWPSNDKSGSYWRNSGDTRRLHPLKKPG